VRHRQLDQAQKRDWASHPDFSSFTTGKFMSTKASPAEPAKRHTYRVALYGRKNSGKSCILAALGLGLERIPHPEGLACVWINDETTIPVPPGGASWSVEDPIPIAWDLDDPAITRHLGRQWMRKAVKELKKGEVPRPTPVDVAPFRFLFDFNDPKTGRGFRVEMIDYSGELVRAEGSEDLFAKRLRTQLETMDGILVLAEAPRPNEESQPLYEELNRLLEAFALLAEQRRGKRIPPFPVALVFNKWDRQSRMDEYSRAQSEVELDTFLRRTPPPPQRGLLNVLQTVSGSTPEVTNCLSFALSAFGRAVSIPRTDDFGKQVLIEVPAIKTPLHSYGLEDPFVWVCRRSDGIEADRLVQAVSGLRFWNIPQTIHAAALSYVAQLKQFVDRFPAKAPERKTAQGLVEQARKTLAKQVGFFAAVAVVLFGLTVNGGFLLYDSLTYYPLERAAESATKDDSLKRWREAESYLSSYVQSNWYRATSLVLIRPPWVAHRSLQSIKQKVAVASEIDTKISALTELMNGNTDIADSALNDISNKLDAIKIPTDYNFLVQRAGSLRTVILKKKIERDANNDAAERRKKFDMYVENAELAQAANYVLSRDVAQIQGFQEKLTLEFRTRAAPKLKHRVGELCQSQRPNWSSAEAAISSFQTSNDVKDVLQNEALFGKLENLSLWVRNHRRVYLYRDWYYKKDESTAQRILTGEDETYKPYVLSYQAYRQSLSTQQNWKLKLSAIELDHVGALQSGVRHYNPKLRVELWTKQGKSFVESIEGEIEVTSAGRIPWTGTKLLTTPLLLPNDEFLLKINMTQYISKVGFGGTWVVGEAAVPTFVLDLSRAIQLKDDAKNPYWTGYPGDPPRVLMALESPTLPKMPELPNPPALPDIESVLFP
jgi:hypothetical protein